MADNPHVNKVVFGAVSIIDITPTTAVEEDVAAGKIFFKADGSQATGTASGGGVVTRQVTFEYNDADAMYYTDATMTPQSITSGSMDINAELPVGSLVVYARTGMAPPMPFPLAPNGVQKIASYTVGSRGTVTIYEVLPE